MTAMPDKCPRCGVIGCKTFEMNGRYIEAIECVMRQRDALRQTLSELADLVVQYNKIDPSDWEFPDLFIHMTRVAKSAQRLVEAMATVEVSSDAPAPEPTLTLTHDDCNVLMHGLGTIDELDFYPDAVERYEQLADRIINLGVGRVPDDA